MKTVQAHPRPHLLLLACLAGAKLILHLALAGRYGYFRDELYFLDCARNLDWGYVDHAPLASWVARLALLLGGSLPVMRLFPALAGAGRVLLTGLIAWRLGGGRYAQAFAAIAAIAVPGYLAVDSTFTLNSFEASIWTAAVYVLIRIIQTGDSRLWLGFGMLCGAGLLNKHSTAFFGLSVAAGIVLTPLRRELCTRWPWLGALAALLIFLPNLAWQMRHDFPTFQYLRNTRPPGTALLGPVDFVIQQIVTLQPALLPLWLAGLIWLFRAQRGRYRALAWAFVVFFATMLILQAKRYYLLGMYPMLLAAGAVALEAGLERWRVSRGRRWPKALLATGAVVAGAVTAPVVLPLLPPDRFVAYERAIGISTRGRAGPLRQVFSDQFGWPELVAQVARVYHALPAGERTRAAIFTANFGEAAAVNHLGGPYGLPTAISGNLNYFLWGPRGATGEVVIVVGANDRVRLQQLFSTVEKAGEHFHPWGMAAENQPIWVCRGLKMPLTQLWGELKIWGPARPPR